MSKRGCPLPRCSKIKPDKKASDGKKDFACSDRLFALNAKLKFYTPEQFFLGKKAEEPHKMPDFDPSSVFVTRSLLDPPDATLTSLKQEVVLMCGIQGSGKSTVAGEWLGKGAGYTVLSNDQLGGRDKTVAAMKVLRIYSKIFMRNSHFSSPPIGYETDLGCEKGDRERR